MMKKYETVEVSVSAEVFRAIKNGTVVWVKDNLL